MNVIKKLEKDDLICIIINDIINNILESKLIKIYNSN